MSNSILADLYNGQIWPCERRPISTPERKELDRKIESEKRYFSQKMSLDDFQRFEGLENLYTSYGDMEQIEAFAYGFRLGALLMVDIYAGNK